MLTMIGTALDLAGLAWLVHNRITGRWEARGRSLGYLNGTLTVIGRHIGRDLETGQGREQFIRECRELIRKGTLTRNIDGRRDALTNSVVQCGERELERQIFSPREALGQEFETTRRAAVALWLIIGAQAGSAPGERYQPELRERLYDLYEKNRKPTQALEPILGPRKTGSRTEDQES